MQKVQKLRKVACGFKRFLARQNRLKITIKLNSTEIQKIKFGRHLGLLMSFFFFFFKKTLSPFVHRVRFNFHFAEVTDNVLSYTTRSKDSWA